MTDKELIKEEIERLFQELKNPLSKGILKHLDGFIDSLPEEHDEDLEEEINRVDDWYPVELKYIQAIARHFAEWQKKQMMKDAVDAEVFVDYNINFGYGSLTANIDLDEQHLKEGDKVKIIIVKTEQQ